MSFEKNLILLGKDKIEEKRFDRVKNKAFQNKPLGGLWTSPEQSKWGWKDFVISEEYRKEYYLSNLLLITLKDSSRIYKIDNEFDFMSCPFRKLKETEKEAYFNLYGGSIIDFEKLSESYDALWVTERAINENSSWICSGGEYKYIGPLFGWDVETVLLFNLDCIEKIC